jgi:hypothetical protein
MLVLGLPLTSSLLLEYSSEYLNEYSSTRQYRKYFGTKAVSEEKAWSVSVREREWVTYGFNHYSHAFYWGFYFITCLVCSG